MFCPQAAILCIQFKKLTFYFTKGPVIGHPTEEISTEKSSAPSGIWTHNLLNTGMHSTAALQQPEPSSLEPFHIKWTDLVRFEGEQLWRDDFVVGLQGNGQGFAVVVAGRVLDQEINHAHVTIAASLHEAGGALE